MEISDISNMLMIVSLVVISWVVVCATILINDEVGDHVWSIIILSVIISVLVLLYCYEIGIFI